jgi:hypothetical protein
MNYASYVTRTLPEGFKGYDDIVREQDLSHSALNVPKGALPKLLATPVNAFTAARPANGSFPLVLYCDGLDGDTVSQIVLNEYLASHGYVVATIPIIGSSVVDPGQTRAQPDLETTIRDLEVAWSFLKVMRNVDGRKLAVIGHSLGAIEAVLFAMRNADVSAVVGLDGTYGFTPNVLTGFYDYNPLHMGAALLDLRRAQTDTGPSAFVLDLSAVNALHFSPRTIVTLKGMYHTDFTMFGILAKEFNFPPFADRNYNTGYAGYQSMCSIVLDFLDLELKGRSPAEARMAQDVASAPGGAMRQLPAVGMPPTPNELVGIAVTQGIDTAKAIVDEYHRGAPDDDIVKESAYNSLGYAMLGRKEYSGAIAALETDTYVYPRSANLADTLGDMYAGAGQIEMARQAYQHALELLPSDSEQNESGKNDLKQAILQSIKSLPAPAAPPT